MPSAGNLRSVSARGLRRDPMLSPPSGWVAVVTTEGGGEGVWPGVPGSRGDLVEGCGVGAQQLAREGHAPIGEVLHGGLAEHNGGKRARTSLVTFR